jgi:trk system potassium uptake protein TrkA
MAIKVARDLAFPNMLDYVPLGKDFSIVEIDPPASFIGKTLIDLNLRAKYHVYIIAIKNTTSDDFTLLPNATYEIQNTDILYALGSMKDLNAIREVEQ